MQSFGQPSRDRCGARPLQDSHTTISRRPFRNRIERSDVEHASGCGIRDVAVADAVRALQAARHIAAIRRKIETIGHRGALERRADSEGKIQESRKQLHQPADGTNRFLESTAALLIAIMPP